MEGLAEGKTTKAAMQDAGYSASTAKRGFAGLAKTPATVEAFRDVIRSVYTPEEFAERVRQGCDAMETRFFPAGSTKLRKVGTSDKGVPNGEVVEREKHEPPAEIKVIAWSERRRYLDMLARLGGYTDAPTAMPGKTLWDQIAYIYEAGPVKGGSVQ